MSTARVATALQCTATADAQAMRCELPPPLRALAATQRCLLTTAQCLAAGLTPSDIRTEIRAGRWIAVLRGVYLIDAEMHAESLAQEVWWHAAVLAHGPGFCLVAKTGARAFAMHGPTEVETTIELAQVGTNPRARRSARSPLLSSESGPELVVRQYLVPPDEVVTVGGLPVRRAALTAVDAALDLNRPRALSVLDSCLHLGLATEAELAEAIDAARGRPGIQQLRALAVHADGRAESMVESFVRLACIDGDVPPDDLQYPVRNTRGFLIAVGDLGWWRRRPRPLLAEADGESVHSQPEPVYRDRRRGNDLTIEACDTLRFTFVDATKPAYVASVVRAALAA